MPPIHDPDSNGNGSNPSRPLWLDTLSAPAEATRERLAAPRPLPARAPQGADHEDLYVSVPEHRFRPERLDATAMASRPRVRFVADGRPVADAEVLDVSSAGLGLRLGEAARLPRGAVLEDLQVDHRGEVIWSGAGLVAHAPERAGDRVGVRLLGRGLDLAELRFRDEVVEGALGHVLAREQEYDRLLPAPWRAGVNSLLNAWRGARQALDAHQAADGAGHWRDPATSLRLCSFVHSRVWPATRQLMEELEFQSQAFDARQVELGLAYAQRALADELSVCEFMHRAYSKPQGYAGDYRMMELGQALHLSGDTLFERYLQYWIQRTSLGRAIRSRGDIALWAARALLAQQRPIRILSLACGPAVELRRLLDEVTAFEHPVEIVLLDQDEHALQSCVDELNRVLEQRDDVQHVTLHALHFSLRQILVPKAGAEREVVRGVLQGMDLIYSMGLFDYLVQSTAQKTAKRLFELLAPGGRLLIGNLCRAADSSWIMEYGLAWHLIYRTPDEMTDMGARIDPSQGHVEVQRDASGYCLFLDARRHAD